MMAVGLISDEEFHRLSTEFVHLSQELDDGWELLKVKEKTYLSKRVLKNLGSVNRKPTADREGLDEADLEEDEGALLEMGDNSSVMFHYLVVYSESYSVPVLCCNVHGQDGRPLTLEEVWSLIPVHYQDRLKGDPWTFLTQQPHPVGEGYVYRLHPCHTEALMACVASINQSEKSNYLVGWLSAVGPVLHLEVPLEYAKQLT